MSDIDVLVIGSGAAGMLAAAVAAQEGQNTVLLSKGQIARSGATATITGDCCVDGRTCVEMLGLSADPRDSVEHFFEDTVKGGKFLNDQHLAERLVSEVGPILQRMRELGLKIGDPIQGPGHRTARGVWLSGMELMQTLRKLLIRAGVRTREEFLVTDLLLTDGSVAGIAGIDQRSGEIVCIEAKTVILATGGAMMMYPVQTAPEELTGDGHSLALRAGARLVDMEMIQFLPCVLADPPIWRGIQFPWVLGPQSGIRAWLLNRFGERFMVRWDPENMEFTTRDVIAIACMKEVIEGRGGPSGGVFLSWAHLPSDIIDFAAKWYFRTHLRGNWHWEGFEFGNLVEEIKSGRAVEVVSASHFFMGGVAINADCATNVLGLFACGEVAGGVHGANRLSGNATSQILVQGQRAGISAAALARRTQQRPVSQADFKRISEELEAFLRRRASILPFEFKEQLQQIANRKVGLIRSGDSLKSALDKVRNLRRDALPRLYCRSHERRYNKEWADAVECRSMLDVLEATTLCGLERRESRGAHYREDFSCQDEITPVWRGSVALTQEGRIVHRRTPVSMPYLTPGEKSVRRF